MSKANQNAPADSNWPKDEFGQHELFVQYSTVIVLAVALVAGLGLSSLNPLIRLFAGKNQKQLVIYCAQDQIYAERIFRQFEKETGIGVRAVYDSEAVKTVGLANRLLAERSHPQCDLFWGNEELRTRQLAAQKVFRETNAWAGFGYRSRRIVFNTNRLSPASVPYSLGELTNKAWQGKVAVAYPQFGTTATHFHALRQLWGDEHWQAWCRALAANKPFLVDGNSQVVNVVGRGVAWIGLTDSDDIAAGQTDGLAVAAVPLREESLLIPNTVALVAGAPHEEAAQKLFEYLQGPQVLAQLIAANALEGASATEITTTTLHPNWERLLADLELTTAKLNTIFLR